MIMKKLIIRLLRKLKLLKYLNFIISINVNNRPIKTPVNSGVGVSYLWLSEPWMISILNQISIEENSTIIDVGVNIGQTLVKLKSVYSEFNYVGFEPNPACVHYTEKLVEANNWKNIQIVPAGLAESFGVTILEHYSQDETDSSASIVSQYRASQEVFKKDIVTVIGSEQAQKFWLEEKVSLIKIDVEGAELGVLKGLEQTIIKHKPIVLIEILPVYSEENKERKANQDAIQNLINQIQYKIYRIHKNSDNSFKKIDFIEKFGIHSNLDWCDYILAPDVSILNKINEKR